MDNPLGLGGKIKTAAQNVMGDRPPIIVHCHLRWDFVWQRPQQIFSRLAKHYPVLFIEEPLHHNGAPAIRVSEPYPNVFRIIPVLNSQAMSFDEQCAVILPVLREWLDSHRFGPKRVAAGVQWFYSPMVAPLWLSCFGEALVVYEVYAGALDCQSTVKKSGLKRVLTCATFGG